MSYGDGTLRLTGATEAKDRYNVWHLLRSLEVLLSHNGNLALEI